MQNAKRWLLLTIAAAAATMTILVWRIERLSSQIDALAIAVSRRPAEGGPVLASPSMPPTCFTSPAFARQIAAEVLVASRAQPPEAIEDPRAHADESAEPAFAVAVASASQIVDQAIAQGRLTRARVAELRTILAAVPGAQADEIRRRIAAAVNRNELIPEDHHEILP